MENIIYFSILLLFLLSPLIGESVTYIRDGVFLWSSVVRWWIGSVPYVTLFLLHNFIAVPNIINHNIRKYVVSLLVILVGFLVMDFLVYVFRTEVAGQYFVRELYDGRRLYDNPHDTSVSIVPIQVIVPLLSALLVLGLNVIVALMFQAQRDNQYYERLETLRLQDELKYLKAQINPHFFMNMLNNIHAMVELDPEAAQDMIMELSKLMRYALYDGEKNLTTLAAESRFLLSYISLMKRRYSSDRVTVSLELPDVPSEEVHLPPLMFMTFVENAFKHGISYLSKSSIHVTLKTYDEKIVFTCENSVAPNRSSGNSGGLGLENVKRRLQLIYNSEYDLEIKDSKDSYSVKLMLPFR